MYANQYNQEIEMSFFWIRFCRLKKQLQKYSTSNSLSFCKKYSRKGAKTQKRTAIILAPLRLCERDSTLAKI